MLFLILKNLFSLQSKRDEAYELLQVCCQQQKKKIVAKVPKNAKSLLNSFLPRFMEQVFIYISFKESTSSDLFLFCFDNFYDGLF